MAWRIGVDIGGTFIDFCALDGATQQLHSLKVLTTPDDPGREVIDGIDLLHQRHGMKPEDVEAFVHGTTVGINTVIQRRGATLALLTTAGFEDVIELARLRMPDMHGLFCARPDPLVPRDRIFGVGGRILADGSEQTPLDGEAVRRAAEMARAAGAEGMIVAFLNAYRNPAHEQAALALVRQAAPEIFVFAATEIWPVIREYERTTTAILNGYVHPRVAGYLTSLEGALIDRGVAARPMVTKSNGGVMATELGKTACVSMLLSGTASGVMGAAFLARQAGLDNALTLDIGGTSADVALVIGGAPQFGTGEVIGEFPLFIPSVSVTSIGDGGGSIAWVDGFGVLKVGPESAGSTPGPACYGRGGTRATITDAMAVCGYLGHTPLAYSSVSMDRGRAEAAVGVLAAALSMSLQATAEAIIQVAISNMFVEVNKLLGRYGVDANDFSLMPFGGAGPMLGCLLARELGMSRVMIARRPGVVSALGGLIADLKNDFVSSVFLDLAPESVAPIRSVGTLLRARATAWLDGQGYSGTAALQFAADMRYRGQSFEIEVLVPESAIFSGDIATIIAAFHRQHRKVYDFADETADVQMVNLRLVIIGATAPPEFPVMKRSQGAPARLRDVEVWHDGALIPMALYLRDDLLHGHQFAGPCIIAQEDTTICIPHGFMGQVDGWGNLHLEWQI
jgi:N-methylhydantoinase A